MDVKLFIILYEKGLQNCFGLKWKLLDFTEAGKLSYYV